MPDGRISQDIAATSLATTDIFPIVQSSTNKRCSFGTLFDAIWESHTGRWRTLPSLPTRSDDSTMLTSDTSLLTIGAPVRYVIAGTTLYGIVRNITANTNFKIAGAPVTANPSSVAVGRPELVQRILLRVAGSYATGTALLQTSGQYVRWNMQAGYICLVEAIAGAVTNNDSRINVAVGSDVVLTANSGDGIKLIDAETFYDGGATADPAKYDVQSGERLEIRCATNGGSNLTVQLGIVVP